MAFVEFFETNPKYKEPLGFPLGIFPSFEKIKSLVLENSVKITRDININMLEN